MVARRGFIAAALSLAFVGAFAVPAGVAGAAGAGTVRQENLVSDQPGVATLTTWSMPGACPVGPIRRSGSRTTALM
jgi:hypothetical protein